MLSWIGKEVAKGLRDRRCKRGIELLSSRLLNSEKDEGLKKELQVLFILLQKPGRHQSSLPKSPLTPLFRGT